MESDLRRASKAPRFNNAIAICKSCGLVQQANNDSKEFLIDKVYKNYQPTYSVSSNVRIYLESFLDKAIAKAPTEPNAKVIEIGSNDGGFLEILKKRGYRPVGFDPAGMYRSLAP